MSRVTRYEQCLLLAKRSGSERMKFGALVVLRGRIIGKGWNRRLRRDEKPPFPVCPWSIHAEQDAVFKALKQRRNLRGAVLYVAGLFSDTGKPYRARKPLSTCHRCHALRLRYGLTTRIPTAAGWRKPQGFRGGLKMSVVSWRKRNAEKPCSDPFHSREK